MNSKEGSNQDMNESSDNIRKYTWTKWRAAVMRRVAALRVLELCVDIITLLLYLQGYRHDPQLLCTLEFDSVVACIFHQNDLINE